jgi:uncharacterized protein (TIGR03086 family)
MIEFLHQAEQPIDTCTSDCLYSLVNVVDLIDDGYAWTGKRIAAVQPSDLSAPTPCTEWNLQQLLTHVLGALDLHLDAAHGLPGDPSRRHPGTGRLDGTPESAFATVTARGARTWREPGVLDGTWTLPMGPVPGPVLAMLHVTELLVHGWDIGRATGENVGIPAELAEPALEFSRRFATPAHRGTAFAAELSAELSAGHPPGDQLVAFLGRRP